MQEMGAASLDEFLKKHPDVEMLEILMPDMNGILRAKRIHRREFEALYSGSLKGNVCMALLTTMGEYHDEVDADLVAGDPDQQLFPVPGTLVPVPWLASPTGQVLASLADHAGAAHWADPRTVLANAVDRMAELGLKPVMATELEFYLIAPGDGPVPSPLLGRVPGTNLQQGGIQYSTAEDMWEQDQFLNDVRAACEAQNVPVTAMLSEFSPGQWEINTHHVEDPVRTCDHALLLKRIVKGVALSHGFSASFMAKPFEASAGNGLHIHTSLYNEEGDNVFAGNAESGGKQKLDVPLSEICLHAIGGLSETMPDAMAIFSPNANSYRRFVAGTYVPLSPSWGYNHRDVALRIPVSADENRRVEHRVAGADANPYLVAAAVLAGMHYGISNECQPGPVVRENTEMAEQVAVLPQRWEAALDSFRASEFIRDYFGDKYSRAFASMRQAECDAFHARISNLDYEWYLRAV
jgi:glutamine synthetase